MLEGVECRPRPLHDEASVYRRTMERLNITLDDADAEKLTCLAQRMHVQPEAVACLLLSSALDETDPAARNVAELLDAIPGAFERAHLGREQAKARKTLPLNEL
jgi:hypothetical protein